MNEWEMICVVLLVPVVFAVLFALDSRREAHAWRRMADCQQVPLPDRIERIEVLLDRDIIATEVVVLGHYLSRASKAPGARA